jgi:hypothetical protein
MTDLRKLQSTIQLRPEDIELLLAQVNDPDHLTRNVSGYDNNLTPGREYWGSAEQPFLRLSPAQFEPNTTNGVRATSADGTPLPNPRRSATSSASSLSMPRATRSAIRTRSEPTCS